MEIGNILANPSLPGINTMKKYLLLSLFSILSSMLLPAMFAQAQAAACGEKDYRCRLNVLLAHIQANPQDIEAYYDVGVLFQQTGNHKEAEEMFSMFLMVGVADSRHMADGYNNRGISRRVTGKYPLAIEDFTKAIELVPNDPALFVNRANVYRDMKNFDRAITEYTKAIGIKSAHSPAYTGRGHVYMLKNDGVNALADFSKAIEINPQESEAYYNRGTLHFGKKDFAKAIPDFDKYISLNLAPPNAISDGHINRGISYAMTGNLNKALEDFTKAIELNPTQVNAYMARAMVYRELKKPELAEADEKKVAELLQPRLK
jgi:tetratricopeptide (TPR) repeat protein